MNTKNGGEEIINPYQKAVTSGDMDKGTDNHGYWIRGTRDDLVISEYKNYKKEGRGSVVNGDGHYRDGGWKPKDTFSKASAYKAFWGGNKAYYNFR